MTIIRRPRSIRGRCSAATSLLVLIVLVVLGASTCLRVRHALGSGALAQAGQAAGPGVPGPLPGHGLACLVAALVLALVLTAGTGLVTRWFLGRALRPIQAIRAHLDAVTVNDLGHRMRIPPGDDEIAELARTTDQVLARLDEAVARQRRFVATTSHELRNPITGLRTELEDALDHPEDTDPRRTLRTALTIADRLDTIITDLLAQARTDAAGITRTAPGHELVDLTELVTQEAVRANRTRARTGDRGGGESRDVPVRLHTRGDVWVCGSRIQVIRALTNLLGNARRHAATAVDLTLTTAHGQAVIAVTDDGPGIPPADRRRVFERFTRLDDARRLDGGGSGLGLAITRDIAHRHRGSLTLEDSRRGARFVLRIPHLDPPAVPLYEPVRSGEGRPVHPAEGDTPEARAATGGRRSITLG